MSMDSLFDSNNRPYISPILAVNEFGRRADRAQQALVDFFNVPAINHLQLLQSCQRNLPDASEYAAEGSLPSIEEIKVDCRTGFKFYTNACGLAFEAAEEVINSMDESLQDLLTAYPVDEAKALFPPENSKLKSHKVLAEIRNLKDQYHLKTRINQRGKYSSYRLGELRKGYTETGKECEEDVTMVAHVCRARFFNDAVKTYSLKAEVKMLIRGEMLLSKFRDKIFCPYDYFSNRYDFEDASNIADYYVNRFPSSFLFIHDTFYIDQRNDNAKDISEPIREFMTKRKSFGPTKVVDMANVKIKDLTLRLGQPYVFMHIGNCEHLVIFTDLRLLHPSDSQDLTEYPVLLCDKYQSPKCCVCQNASPAFIISESDRIPICPAFMCSDCFNEFHYEGDNRIGDFKAFHYIDHALGEF